MGAIFSLQRIFFRRGVLNDDERSLRGYEFYVNNGDPLNFVGEEPSLFAHSTKPLSWLAGVKSKFSCNTSKVFLNLNDR